MDSTPSSCHGEDFTPSCDRAPADFEINQIAFSGEIYIHHTDFVLNHKLYNQMVYHSGIATGCLLSLCLITEGLPRWPRGLRCLSLTPEGGPALVAEWFKALPLTARCFSLLRTCPGGRVV